MIVVTSFEQGSEEWFAARAGIPSASCFDKIVDSKGNRSKQFQAYAYQLAGERILGEKEESYANAAMERGVELESKARGLYSRVNRVEVQEVAMCYKDERKAFLCSPDGLVGDYGGIEIKCPSLKTHVEYAYKGKLPAKYHRQVQGALYITGREWWDFVSYYPGMPLFVVRVLPDLGFHAQLAEALDALCDRVDEIVNKIR